MLYRALPLALAAFLVVGCQSGPTQPQAAGPAQQPAEPVAVVEQILGDDAALTIGGVILVDSQQQLDDIGVTRLDQLNIDFDRHQVVILSLGECPTGGFWGHIDGVQRVGDVLYVQARVNQPGDDQAVTQAITHPFAAAVIERTAARTAYSDPEQVEGQPHPAEADNN